MNWILPATETLEFMAEQILCGVRQTIQRFCGATDEPDRLSRLEYIKTDMSAQACLRVAGRSLLVSSSFSSNCAAYHRINAMSRVIEGAQRGQPASRATPD